MKRQNVRTLSLIVCTLTYLLVGAAVFDALESDNEMQQVALVQRIRRRLLDKYNMSEADYDILEATIVKGRGLLFCNNCNYDYRIWAQHADDHRGKTFCMFYALAGIPLGLVMFQSIGERMNTFAAQLLRFVRRISGRKPEVTQMDLIFIASGWGTFLIAAGAWAFHRYEGWSYFDSIYYCFTTLTTIGFGDFVALQKDGALQSRPDYVVFSLVFIMFGLAVISAAMNLLVLRFLTMNTEDEKRDEREALLAARGLVRVDSSDEEETAFGRGADDEVSICSCSCYRLPYGEIRQRQRIQRDSIKADRMAGEPAQPSPLLTHRPHQQ
ncbi:unnamed protein product, partial [Mesorhabditis spiculigera]